MIVCVYSCSYGVVDNRGFFLRRIVIIWMMGCVLDVVMLVNEGWSDRVWWRLCLGFGCMDEDIRYGGIIKN